MTVNKDGLEPGQPVDFETIQRTERARARSSEGTGGGDNRAELIRRFEELTGESAGNKQNKTLEKRIAEAESAQGESEQSSEGTGGE